MLIDLTTGCNAACPMCSRTGNPNIEDHPDEITLEKFKQYFPVEFIRQLEVIKFCGNFGDPAFAKDCVAIHQYIDEANPDITLILHTNGGLRNRKFWQDLGEVYAKKPNRIIFFHIDGLEDTNHLYRVNVNFDVVIKNAKTAIASGAQCLWAFIPFAHNEHQIEEAEQMAAELGFVAFAVKISGRFDGWKPFKFYDKKTEIVKSIYPPTSPEFKVDKPLNKTELPVCVAETRRDIYVDARGNVLPCCWYASSYEDYAEVREILNQWGSINLNERPLIDILKLDLYNGAIQDIWNGKPTRLSYTCFAKCRNASGTHYWKINENTVSGEEAKWANMKDPEWLKKNWKFMEE